MNRSSDTFQLVTLACVMLLVGGRALHLKLRKGINPIVLGSGKSGLRRAVELGFFVFIVVWGFQIIRSGLHLRLQLLPDALSTRLIDAPAAQVAGAVLIIAGLILFILALVSFGSSWRVGIDEAAPGDLVTGGVFRISRNPIFVFMDLYFIGTFLINGTTFFLLCAIGMIIGVHYQILQEEEFLERTYGQAYRDYRARVGRYLIV